MIKLINKVLALSGLKLEKINPEMMDGLFINNIPELGKHLKVDVSNIIYFAKGWNVAVFAGDIRSYNYKQELKLLSPYFKKIGNTPETMMALKTILSFIENHCAKYFDSKDFLQEFRLMNEFRISRKYLSVA